MRQGDIAAVPIIIQSRLLFLTWPEGKAVREMTDHLPEKRPPSSEILFYQTEDGRSQIEVRLDQNTVWLFQSLMAELFQTTKQNISLHIQNIYAEGELAREGTVKEYLTVQQEGGRKVSRSLEHYNLDVIIPASNN
jgi:hypothetical protein